MNSVDECASVGIRIEVEEAVNKVGLVEVFVLHSTRSNGDNVQKHLFKTFSNENVQPPMYTAKMFNSK